MAHWLKLDIGILRDEKIELIRALPEGDSLFVLWIGLLCLAMKKETDMLYIAEGIPYGPEEIATVVNLDAKVVRMGIEVFQRFGMVQALEDGALHITNFREHQAIDKMSRQRELTTARVQRFRERARDVTRYGVTGNATELEGEVELEKEKSIVALTRDDTPVVVKPSLPIAETTREVIAFLNERADTKFNADGQGHRSKVGALLKKGYTTRQMKQVIAVKALKWKDDPKMRDYLRPSTLFAPAHFDDYLGEYETEKARL
jgi:predicted phage replisome organizer/uncharacterized phage protein (TIGR02220 family)